MSAGESFFDENFFCFTESVAEAEGVVEAEVEAEGD